MIKKTIAGAIMSAAITLGANANAAETKQLPAPDLKQGTAPLMELLDARKSVRSFDKDKKIDDQTLSEILWAAFGMNSRGTRTIPTGMNRQNMKVFLLREDGIWFYDAKENRLEKISDENAIKYTAEMQSYVLDAPVHLVYTSSDKRFGYSHAGSAYQNVYLYAAAKGLATVARAAIDTDALHKALKLDDDEFVMIHQPVGYAK